MFERFTEPALQVVVLAQDQARDLGHNYIGTEHLVLGLLREEEGVAARVLASLGVRLGDVRADVARIVGAGEQANPGQIPFTPRAKRVLELAREEALSLGHDRIGTEHILLGMVRENQGVAARILVDHAVDAEMVRNATVAVLSGRTPEARPSVRHGGFCYLLIPADDIERSSTFYRDAFGWRLRERGDGALAFDDRAGHLSGSWVAGRPPSSEPGLLPYIMVDDVAEACETVVAHGGEIVAPLGVDPGELTAWFRDPGGNVIGLYQEPGG